MSEGAGVTTPNASSAFAVEPGMLLDMRKAIPSQWVEKRL